MRFSALALALACLSIAASAEARRYYEIGPQLSISLPTGVAGEATDLGISAGVTATFMRNPTTGIGVDLAYHYWPGSASANNATDAMFSSLSGTPITGSKWTLSAFQVTGHLKVVPPVSGSVAPWIQVGPSIYRVDPELKVPVDQLQAAGWQVQSESTASPYKFGYASTVGLDFEIVPSLKLGLDASYHYLLWKVDSGANFTAFTIGVHLLR